MIEKVYFKNNLNQKLVGILYKSNNGKIPIAIYCHGYRSTKESEKVKPLEEKLASNKISLFAFDFSGRGESQGKFEDTTITQYINDLKCAVNYISKINKKIGVIGNSLGGLVALQQATKEKKIKALALLSPVSYFPWTNRLEFAPKNLEKWKEKGYTFTYNRKFSKLKINYSFYEDGLKYKDNSMYNKIKIPTLIIHGTEDECVSIDFSEELIKHLKNHKFIKLKGADHNYTNKKDFNKIINETVKWLKNNL